MDVTKIELSDKAQRQRRNLVFAAFVIITIRGFCLQIESSAFSGVSVIGLTTDGLVYTLLGFLLYSFISFLLSCFEETSSWKLHSFENKILKKTIEDKTATAQKDLDTVIATNSENENNLYAEGGSFTPEKEEFVLTQGKKLADEAKTDLFNYKKLHEFLDKHIVFMNIRLIFWDLGVAVILFITALCFVIFPHLLGIFVYLPSLPS